MDNRMDIASVLADIRAVRAQMAQSHRIQAEALPRSRRVIEERRVARALQKHQALVTC